MRDTSRYWVDGVRWPSVTEVLDLAGINEYAGIDPQVVANAGRRGNEVHQWTDLIDTGHVDPDNTIFGFEVAGYIAAYMKFKDECKPEIIANEMVVRNPVYRYCGQLDRAAYLRGTRYAELLTVYDIKAVYLVGPAVPLQLCGYSLAYAEEKRVRVAPARASLQLKADGNYRLKWHTEFDDVHDWLSAVRVAWFKINNGLATLEEQNV